MTRAKPKSSARERRFAAQRRSRGWDDSETWSLDHSLAKLILPRLKRFKELNNGIPYGLNEENWNAALDKMIAGFEVHVKGSWQADKKDMVIARRGIALFAKYYPCLWW